MMNATRSRISFRVIHAHDSALLEEIYAAGRAWEFQHASWPDEEKTDFLKRQFTAQDLHYQRAFPNATRRIIMLGETDIGRLYLDHQDTCLRIIEFGILPAWRGRGIGTDILRSLLNEAHGGKVPVRLSVERESPALRLYLRHGFVKTGESGHHLFMEARPDLRPREF